jgi:uncharacterized protein YbjT (DUF2867 family)
MTTAKKLNVLVYGATGTQSGPVVEKLLASGHQPYVFTRQREKAARLAALGAVVVEGEMTDYEAVRRASEGMDAVSLLVPFGAADSVTLGERAVDAARAAGVGLIVWNTSGPIPPAPTGNPSYDLRRHLVDYLRRSGVPHITLVPGVYAENLLGPWNAPAVAHHNQVSYPTPADMVMAWLPCADLAALTVAALERPHLAGSTFHVSGAEALDGNGLAGRFAQALGRDITYRPLPPAEFEAILAGLMPAAVAAEVAGEYQRMWDSPERRPAFVNDMGPVLEALPVQLTPMREWVKRYAAAFSRDVPA